MVVHVGSHCHVQQHTVGNQEETNLHNHLNISYWRQPIICKHHVHTGTLTSDRLNLFHLHSFTTLPLLPQHIPHDIISLVPRSHPAWERGYHTIQLYSISDAVLLYKLHSSSLVTRLSPLTRPGYKANIALTFCVVYTHSLSKSA